MPAISGFSQEVGYVLLFEPYIMVRTNTIWLQQSLFPPASHCAGVDIENGGDFLAYSKLTNSGYQYILSEFFNARGL